MKNILKLFSIALFLMSCGTAKLPQSENKGVTGHIEQQSSSDCAPYQDIDFAETSVPVSRQLKLATLEGFRLSKSASGECVNSQKLRQWQAHCYLSEV